MQVKEALIFHNNHVTLGGQMTGELAKNFLPKPQDLPQRKPGTLSRLQPSFVKYSVYFFLGRSGQCVLLLSGRTKLGADK